MNALGGKIKLFRNLAEKVHLLLRAVDKRYVNRRLRYLYRPAGEAPAGADVDDAFVFKVPDLQKSEAVEEVEAGGLLLALYRGQVKFGVSEHKELVIRSELRRRVFG